MTPDQILAENERLRVALARSNELLVGARHQCRERTKDLAAAEVTIRHLQRDAIVGHYILELEKQIRRLRRLAEDRPGDFPIGISPADVVTVIRGEIAEVEAELDRSPAAQREAADVLTGGLHLLVAHDGVLLVELEAVVTRLDRRLTAMERGSTWKQAKVEVACG